MNPEPQLPDGWRRVPITDACHVEMGQSPPSSTYNELGDGLPFFQGKAEFGNLFPTAKKWCSAPKKIASEGDVLISVRAPVGPTNLAPSRCCIGRGLAALSPKDGTNARFILYQLRLLESDLARKGAGTTFKAISGKVLRQFPIRWAPPEDQSRIVAKIEELFSDLDAGVAALERARANLKRYRAAVLKAAVEGKLTEEWRREHPDVEPASELLERILVERRKKWEEEQVKKYEAKGKKPPKGWQGKYKEPANPDFCALPAIPDRWCWTTLDALADVGGGITKGKATRPGPGRVEVPYLRVANVQRGFLDLSEIKTVWSIPERIAKYELKAGDVLFTEGGDRDKLGRGWVWEDQIPGCIHQNHIFRARLFVPEQVQPRFLSYHGNSFGKAWFTQTGKQTVNLASISQTVLRSFPIPLPPPTEAEEIVCQTEELREAIDRAETMVDIQLRRSSRLRKAILKRAFDGSLVRGRNSTSQQGDHSASTHPVTKAETKIQTELSAR